MFYVIFPSYKERTSFAEIPESIFGSDFTRLSVWIGHYRVPLLNKDLRYCKPFPAVPKEKLYFSTVLFHSSLTRCSTHHIRSFKTAVNSVCQNLSCPGIQMVFHMTCKWQHQIKGIMAQSTTEISDGLMEEETRLQASSVALFSIYQLKWSMYV